MTETYHFWMTAAATGNSKFISKSKIIRKFARFKWRNYSVFFNIFFIDILLFFNYGCNINPLLDKKIKKTQWKILDIWKNGEGGRGQGIFEGVRSSKYPSFENKINCNWWLLKKNLIWLITAIVFFLNNSFLQTL